MLLLTCPVSGKTDKILKQIQKKTVLLIRDTTINPSSSYFITSKPNFSHTNNKVTIQIFYFYVASNNDKNSFNKDSTVFRILSELSSTLAQTLSKRSKCNCYSTILSISK